MVIRGVNLEEILEEIKIKVPSAHRVHRMRNKDKIWPLIAVDLDSFFISDYL